MGQILNSVNLFFFFFLLGLYSLKSWYVSWTWQLFSWFAVRVGKAEHHYNTNLYFGKLSRNSLRVLVGQLWNARQRGGCPEALARTAVPLLGLNITRKVARHQKTKSKSVSVLHGCQGLKGRSYNWRTSTVARRLSPSLNAKAAGMSLCHPGFLTWYPLKNGFPPQCTTMMWEARARPSACCDVNLMTSCCSDGRSKQLNKGIVVGFFFSPFFSSTLQEGAPLPVLLLSSRHQTVEPLWAKQPTSLPHKTGKIKTKDNPPDSFVSMQLPSKPARRFFKSRTALKKSYPTSYTTNFNVVRL